MPIVDPRKPAETGAMQMLVFAAIVGGTIFVVSLLGILTRPSGFLAAVWPANAVLLGMMVRQPAYATPLGWAAAFAGYAAADLVTGSLLLNTIWLTAANVAGAMIGTLAFRRLNEEDRALRRPVSVLYVFGACSAAALGAAIVGAGAASLLFGRDFAGGAAVWFIAELANYLIVLPMWLTFPGLRAIAKQWRRMATPSRAGILHASPALALLASAAMGNIISGPGALAFPIPALLWCALTYGMFTSTMLTMLLCGWLMLSLPGQFLPLYNVPNPIRLLDSIRLGVALVALGPLTVASTNTARKVLIAKLSYQANHDELTGALSRRAVMNRGRACLDRLARTGSNVALLMLDIDHFKIVNDRMGHAGGDAALRAFFRLVANELREGDLFGRTGGEEFAILLPHADLIEATGLAERIRLAVEAAAIKLPSGETLRMTVSTGVAAFPAIAVEGFDALLLAADRALYEAKANGRNTVRVSAKPVKVAA